MTEKILPQGSVSAVKTMVEIAESLLDLMDREARALATQDAMSFLTMQDEKNRLVDKYEAATEEFKDRIEDFRAVDNTMLSKLEMVQDKLAKQSLENNELIKRLESDKEIRQVKV